MPALTKSVGEHDDETSDTHERHFREKREREKTHYEECPAVVIKAGSGILDGYFKTPIEGFSFRLKGGTAVRALDSKAYTKEAVAMSKSRARFKRTRLRDGKTVIDYGKFQNGHGAISLVTTVAPWQMGAMGRLRAGELEDLMLRLAEAQAQEIKDVSGRDVFGGGCHLTKVSCCHWHLHVPKVQAPTPAKVKGRPATPGEVHPKTLFKTAGDWTVGASRLERRFPGLLTAEKRKRLADNLAAKDQAHLIDFLVAARLDREIERYIAEKGVLFQKAYEADLVEYKKRKGKAQKEEPLKKMAQTALGHYNRHGVWPICYRAMTLSFWRMLPASVRGPIMLCIRVHQIVHKPSRVFSMGIKMICEIPHEKTKNGVPHYK